VRRPKPPLLDRLYDAYVETNDMAAFVAAVADSYLLSTLARLVAIGRPVSRRAAVLAIGMLGDCSHNAVLGKALGDRDRGVRLLADSGIRQLWRRDGSRGQRRKLARICRLNENRKFREATERATLLIEEAPQVAEGWNQRGEAYYGLKRYEAAADDYHQTLELNAYHFRAAACLGHCYVHLDEPLSALECFHRALLLNREQEDVRGRMEMLKRTLEGR
jgi:tetratricopeptide (TPR) repeat protein